MKLKTLYKNRLEQLRKGLKPKTAFFLNKKTDVTYFTGFTGEDAFLFITDQQFFFLTDGRYFEQLKNECLVPYGLVEIKTDNPLVNAVKTLIQDLSVFSLFVREEEIHLDFYRKLSAACPNLKWVNSLLPAEIRMRKDDYEVEVIRQNLLITELGFHYAIRKIEEVDTELELAAELEYFLKKKGAQGLSFETIVASGSRSAMPHGLASQAGICSDDVLLMDFGILKDSYCSDFTRCYYFGTMIRSKISEVQSVVFDALQAAEAIICPGVRASEVDKVARDIIVQAGYGKYFTHSLGHGVGLDIHEAPRIGFGSDVVLKSGMVFTVEPGIYLPEKFGIRLEDMVVVTPRGCEVLTQAAYDL